MLLHHASATLRRSSAFARVLAACLVLALVLGRPGAALHVLGHLADRPALPHADVLHTHVGHADLQHDTHPADTDRECALCPAFAELAVFVAAHAAPVALPPAPFTPLASPAHACAHAAPCASYLARAPPPLLQVA